MQTIVKNSYDEKNSNNDEPRANLVSNNVVKWVQNEIKYLVWRTFFINACCWSPMDGSEIKKNQAPSNGNAAKRSGIPKIINPKFDSFFFVGNILVIHQTFRKETTACSVRPIQIFAGHCMHSSKFCSAKNVLLNICQGTTGSTNYSYMPGNLSKPCIPRKIL